jgi:hypothetical protein
MMIAMNRRTTLLLLCLAGVAVAAVAWQWGGRGADSGLPVAGAPAAPAPPAFADRAAGSEVPAAAPADGAAPQGEAGAEAPEAAAEEASGDVITFVGRVVYDPMCSGALFAASARSFASNSRIELSGGNDSSSANRSSIRIRTSSLAQRATDCRVLRAISW